MRDLNVDDSPRCTICASALYADEHGRYACHLCQQRGIDMIRAMPSLYRQLGPLLQPGARRAGGRVSGSKSAPLPCSDEVLNLRARGGLVTIFATWEDAIRDELGFTAATFRGSAEQTLAGVVAFLANNAPWMYASFAAVDEYHRELRQIHGQARRLVTGEKPEIRITVCCTADGCTGLLRVTVSTPGARCTTCGTQYGHDDVLNLPLAQRTAA